MSEMHTTNRGGLGPVDSKTMEETPVDIALQELEGEIADLRVIAVNLCKRLERVSTLPDPTEATIAVPGDTYKVPLAVEIDSLTRRVVRIKEELSYATEHLGI